MSIQSIRDPKPDVERIEVLAQRIIQGDIILPKFQRDFVWDRSQILDLFDSILKNYPIGSVLLWLSKQVLRAENNLAGLPIKERPPEYPVNYLLDGQQRLSSICGALFFDGADPNSVWNVAYDLRAQEFIHLDTLDETSLHIVRLNKLPDAVRFFRQVSAIENLDAVDKAELKQRAEELFNRFKGYAVATITLSDMPIESVAPIFERINSTGTRLTIVDLMRAATWSPEFDLIDTIDGLVLDAIEPKGFADIDRKAVLRNLSAAAGGAFTVESIDTLRNKTAEELKRASVSTVEAYKRATDFLTIEIGIPNAKVIPYTNQMVVLSETFRRLEQLSSEQLIHLKHWFWKTTLTGYFSGWNSGQMNADLQSIERFAKGDASALDIGPVPFTESIWTTRQFRLNNAHAKMFGLMLAHNKPRDLITGQAITIDRALAWNNAREYHHFFPDSYLKKQDAPPSKCNCVANCVLLTSASNKAILDKPPSIYLPELQEALGGSFMEVMESNLLSQRAIEAAMKDDFEGFLLARSQTLQQHALKLSGQNS